MWALKQKLQTAQGNPADEETQHETDQTNEGINWQKITEEELWP